MQSLSAAMLLLPQDLLVLVAVLLAVTGLFLRLAGLRFGTPLVVAGVGFLVLPEILGPIVEEILAQVPGWLVALLLLALILQLIRAVLTLFLGRDAVGHLIALAVVWLLSRLGAVPRVFGRGGRGILLLLNSPSRGRRLVGLALAVALGALGGWGVRLWTAEHPGGSPFAQAHGTPPLANERLAWPLLDLHNDVIVGRPPPSPR
jgi:hypothetical protein